ncbi:MAG: MBL fold metallo-hydrolase [Synergistaceae bacterium]|jgi:glyoxylase-like metal-dependent hydrolase (beta-lactamase superfamily II)|nr:MBL fold metallo-hydrolase [Synergistaceae bacterium]
MRQMLFLAAGVLFLAFFGVGKVCAATDKANPVFRSKVGTFEVYALSERQSEGSLSILIDASSRDIEKYVSSGSYPTAVNTFLVRTKDGAILIDAGLGEKLEGNLKSIGLSPDDIGTILITHSHGDHIGGLVKNGSPAFPKAKVYISKAEFSWSPQVRRSLSAYAGCVSQFDPGNLADSGLEIMEGIRAIQAYGHTPGHTIFLIESAGERLLVWGDLTHAMAIQMPRPDISVTYDSDPVRAAAIRKEVLKFVTDGKVPVAGMHVAYPAIGNIERDLEVAEGYKFIPSAE